LGRQRRAEDWVTLGDTEVRARELDSVGKERFIQLTSDAQTVQDTFLVNNLNLNSYGAIPAARYGVIAWRKGIPTR